MRNNCPECSQWFDGFRCGCGYELPARSNTGSEGPDKPTILCQHCGHPAITRIVKRGFTDRPLCKICYASDVILYDPRWN